MTNRIHIGIDTGGTFTDFFVYDQEQASIRIHKVLSTPGAPERAILKGLTELGLNPKSPPPGIKLRFVHGTTVGTNTVLQGQGIPTAYVTNAGFADLLTLGRQTREHLYQLLQPRVTPPVPDHLLFELNTRMNADGKLIQALSKQEVTDLAIELQRRGVRAVAINLLYSWIDATTEKDIEAAISGLDEDIFVSRSSFVLPQSREYERGIATWLNASIGPVLEHYLARLNKQLYAGHLAVMQSSCLTISALQAGKRAVSLLLSGPAGGLTAARAIGSSLGRTRLLTFDMGGTSTDVSLIDRNISLTSEGRIGRWPISLPMADIHTLGAGGGSIAFVDEGGALRVGPDSAGADPGPACYGLGGVEATVTDANLVLGLLPAELRLAGSLSLNRDAAWQAIDRLAKQLQLTPLTTARGLVDITNANMAEALRHISLQRGHDPADFTLVCFGGAAGLHLCDLAEMLGVQEALVPINSGVFSALGLIQAAPGRQLALTLQKPLRARTTMQQLAEAFASMETVGRQELEEEGITARLRQRRWLDIRYVGQSHPLEIEFADARTMEQTFISDHYERYGHTLDLDIEVVTAHLSISGQPLKVQTGPQQGEMQVLSAASVHGISEQVEVIFRSTLSIGQEKAGPLLIVDTTATTWVKPGWQVRLTAEGSLLAHYTG